MTDGGVSRLPRGRNLLWIVASLTWLWWATTGPIQWMDNGVFVFEASSGPFFSPHMGAQSHPLFHLLARMTHEVFGAVGLAYLNATLMIPVVLLVFRIAVCLGSSDEWATVAAGATVFAHCVFWISSKVEVYTLNLLLILLAYWLFLDVRLQLNKRIRVGLIGLMSSLALASHQLTLIAMTPLAVVMLLRDRGLIWWAVPGLLLGCLPVLPGLWHEMAAGKGFLPLLRQYLTGRSAQGGAAGWESALGRFDLIWQDRKYVALWALSLLGFPALGLLPWLRRIETSMIWLSAVAVLLFSVGYAVPDRFTFSLPAVALLSIVGAVNISSVIVQPGSKLMLRLGWVSVLLLPVLSSTMILAAQAGWRHIPSLPTTVPGRDDLQYFLAPYLKDSSAERFVAEMENWVAPGQVLVTDYTPKGALESAQASGRFLGRRLLECEYIRGETADIGDHALLVRNLNCEHLSEFYEFRRDGPGYRLIPKWP